jgi:hypothetical protein
LAALAPVERFSGVAVVAPAADARSSHRALSQRFLRANPLTLQLCKRAIANLTLDVFKRYYMALEGRFR